MKKLFALAAMALFATACNEAPTSAPLQPIRFAQAPYRVSVAEVRVENRTPQRPNAVDSQMPTPPATAVQQWVNDRLVAAGSSGMLLVSIENATVLENKLPKTDGIKGFFTDDQDAKYDGSIIVNFRLYNGVSTIPQAEASVNIARGRSINEKATLVEREQFYQQLVADLMRDFNAEAESRVRQYLGQYVSY